MIRKPKDQSARDSYNIGYGRKYDEFDRISNPYRWLGIAVIAVGVLMLCAYLFTVGIRPNMVFESADGQQIVVPNTREYALLNNNTIFIRLEDTTEQSDQVGVLVVGGIAVLAGLLFYCIYTSGYVVAKCKEAGWSYTQQREEIDKED